jgi:Tol biopolymer transport system component
MRRLFFPVLVWGAALGGLAVVGFPAQANIPPGSSGKIVFGQVFPNYGATINPDGSGEHDIGSAGHTTCNTLSPDGSKVLCNLWSSMGVPQPATANPDGSHFRLLNQHLPFDLFCLNWSPNGKRLLCHSEGMANPADAGLYTARSSNASDLVRVSTTLPGGFDIGYGYSPDGSRILYARFDSKGHGALFSVKPDGSDPIRLSPRRLFVIDLGFFDRVGADWSPNNSRVTFAAFDSTAPSSRALGVFVVRAAGTGLREITPHGLGALSAQWSPNGALIAFTSCKLPTKGCALRRGQAWIVHPDGTGLRQVTRRADGGAFLTPTWSPNSHKLLVNNKNQHRFSLWTVNTHGSGLFKLETTPHFSQYEWGIAPTR